ncbi:hypothetical protein AAG570_009851 [Ranatra chinensis]|uniref:Uncharacterized protein n=1 Tax=Ranatra chinensis TaxID=642074 RepID=A0ABD0YQ93_9HEMI
MEDREKRRSPGGGEDSESEENEGDPPRFKCRVILINKGQLCTGKDSDFPLVCLQIIDDLEEPQDRKRKQKPEPPVGNKKAKGTVQNCQKSPFCKYISNCLKPRENGKARSIQDAKGTPKQAKHSDVKCGQTTLLHLCQQVQDMDRKLTEIENMYLASREQSSPPPASRDRQSENPETQRRPDDQRHQAASPKETPREGSSTDARRRSRSPSRRDRQDTEDLSGYIVDCRVRKISRGAKKKADQQEGSARPAEKSGPSLAAQNSKPSPAESSKEQQNEQNDNTEK